MTTLEKLLATPEGWPTVLQMIRSEQLPPARVAQIIRDYPRFAKWMEGRS